MSQGQKLQNQKEFQSTQRSKQTMTKSNLNWNTKIKYKNTNCARHRFKQNFIVTKYKNIDMRRT